MSDERVTEPQPTAYESALRALQQLAQRGIHLGRRISELTDVLQQEGLTDEVRAEIGRELRALGNNAATDYAWAAAAIDPGEPPPATGAT